jgi:hypothetical protein
MQYTKYVYIKSTTVYVPSSKLGSPTHSFASECAPPPTNGGGGTFALRVRGWGSPNSDDFRKSLALCLLCAYMDTYIFTWFYMKPTLSYSAIYWPLLLPCRRWASRPAPGRAGSVGRCGTGCESWGCPQRFRSRTANNIIEYEVYTLKNFFHRFKLKKKLCQTKKCAVWMVWWRQKIIMFRFFRYERNVKRN